MYKAPYDERNEADYRVISNNIEIALNIISTDLTVPATEASLAKLAGCSRGTLRNRVYPIERLKTIKTQRAELLKKSKRSARVTLAHRLTVDVHIDEKKNLEVQLGKSRSEIAVWVTKCSGLERKVKKLHRLKDVLLKGRKLLENEIEELKSLLQEKGILLPDERI